MCTDVQCMVLGRGMYTVVQSIGPGSGAREWNVHNFTMSGAKEE